MSRLLRRALVAALIVACSDARVSAEPVVRQGTAAGAVITRKFGEEVQFVTVPSWQVVEPAQDLLPGDVLRTNATGQLAVLFADQTQIRLGRNTSLIVKSIGGGADSAFGLESGTIWGRAERGGLGLTIDTPAASAAIRGTDWNLSVEPDGHTTLIVLEGVIELANAFGSVSVAEGEAAAASIGEAPTKIVIVDPDDREQMLFHLSLRGAFGFLPASPFPAAQMREAAARARSVPPQSRSADDWLTLAEAALSLQGREAAAAALAVLSGRRLSPSQQARADLVAGLIAGSEKRYQEASVLLERAAPLLDPERRAVALFSAYFARSLDDPALAEHPPQAGSGVSAALAEALIAGFLDDIEAAADRLEAAERAHPDDPILPATLAQVLLLLDKREAAAAAIDRALALDPDNAQALEARANLKAGTASDLEGAIADLERSLEIAPGASSAWNTLGLVHTARDDTRSAEAAYLRAIALDPEDPVSHANLAILYLDQGRMEEARREIELALASDPGFSIALVARGRYYLQTGELDKAITDLLAGTTDNPAYSQGLLLLAAAYFEKGERAPGEQALENADRLDPNDPVTAALATAVAIDDYRSADAIRHAQSFLERGRARGGAFASLQANQEAGSTLNNAFRLQGLNAWGQYYGDAVFQPFAGSAYIDQAVGGSVNPYANNVLPGGNAIEPAGNASSFSSFFQGLLLDPIIIAGRSRSANIIRRPFLEGAVGLGGVVSDDESDWVGEAEIQGTTYTPFPASVFATVDRTRFPGSRPGNATAEAFLVDADQLTGTGYLAAAPTPNDRVIAFASAGEQESRFEAVPNPALFPLGATAVTESTTRTVNSGIGWSHSLGYRNVVNAALFYNEVDAESSSPFPPAPSFFALDVEDSQQSVLGGVSHLVELGPVTVRYGAEGGLLDLESNSRLRLVPAPGGSILLDASDDRISIGRVHADLYYPITDRLTAEMGLQGTMFSGDTAEETRAEPRAGVAFTPVDGHWLRAGYVRDGLKNPVATLSPIGVVGLQPIQSPLAFDGYADTLVARWDAEWSPFFFTSLDLQHQELHQLSIAIPASAATIGLAEGRIDRAAFTANLFLGHGFGVFAGLAYADSENRDRASTDFGEPLPFVPELAAQIGVTYVHPANVRLTLAANHVGERTGDAAGTPLDDYWTVDASLVFEPFGKRIALEAQAYNLLDEEFEVAPDTPGFGRTVMARLKVRF